MVGGAVVSFAVWKTVKNHNTTIDWYSYLWEVCIWFIENGNNRKIGGNNLSKSTSIFTEPKDNCRVFLQQWVFWGLFWKMKLCFLVLVSVLVDWFFNTLMEMHNFRAGKGQFWIPENEPSSQIFSSTKQCTHLTDYGNQLNGGINIMKPLRNI